MPRTYTVKDGDCISSIAFDAGLLPDTIWNHPSNAGLRQQRKQRNILLPGDQVVIPDRELREIPAPTDRRHRFVRKTISERLRIVVHDEEDKPFADKRYLLTVDGAVMEGQTSGEGLVERVIPPNARAGSLVVGNLEADGCQYKFDLHLGGLNPIEDTTGVQQRLHNLGFECGKVDGVVGPKTAGAIAEFQRYWGLEITGELNDATRAKLADDHLS